MVQVQIQLFLNAQGRKAFPGWLRFFAKVVRQFDGFVNIQLLQVEDSPSLGMALIFETKAHQEAFFNSPVFEQLMSRIQPCCLLPYRKLVLRAKNLYEYPKASPGAAAGQGKAIIKPQASDMAASVQKAKARAAAKPQAKPVQKQNVVGMADFMEQRKKQG